ncbi:signal peptidase I [Paenibacillus sp. FA6]|uniref:signal peptidase I n=1 Tax=Paenibacillus sp. FA6 TaxID=3413029 RepID=UPI003F654A6A
MMMKILKQYLPTIIIAFILSIFIRTYVAEAMKVPTGSMIPTIQINDHLLVEKLMWMTSLNHGDIIVFQAPAEDKRYVKRLIGLPGDEVEIKDGELYRNKLLISEPYIQERMNYNFGPVVVPVNEYFFLGDNRNDSFDSHAWDYPFIEKGKLIGKVLIEIPTHGWFE